MKVDIEAGEAEVLLADPGLRNFIEIDDGESMETEEKTVMIFDQVGNFFSLLAVIVFNIQIRWFFYSS